MDRSLKKYVNECLRAFEQENAAQLRVQEVHAASRGQALSDAEIPLAYDPAGRKRGLYDLFDVEVCLLLFARRQHDDSQPKCQPSPAAGIDPDSLQRAGLRPFKL